MVHMYSVVSNFSSSLYKSLYLALKTDRPQMFPVLPILDNSRSSEAASSFEVPANLIFRLPNYIFP